MKISDPTAVAGENLALKYLKGIGYKILDRNFRVGYGEIDIVAIDKDILVFIEVKTRKSLQFGEPKEAITFFKLRSLIRTAEFYKLSHPKTPEAMRIDAVSIKFLKGKPEEVEHIKNISGF